MIFKFVCPPCHGTGKVLGDWCEPCNGIGMLTLDSDLQTEVAELRRQVEFLKSENQDLQDEIESEHRYWAGD